MNERSNNIQDELKEIAPLLSSFNKQQKNAPAFYFENMQQRVLNEISITKHELSLFDKSLNALLQIFRPKYALPLATITILFAVASVLHMPENNFIDAPNKVVLNNEAISNFLAEEDISIDIISNNLKDSEVSKITLLFASKNIKQNNINDYILDDIDDSFPAEMTL
jgi:hypothetical protein